MSHDIPLRRARRKSTFDITGMSARESLSRGQILFLMIAAALLVVGLLLGATLIDYLMAFIGFICFLYVGSLIYDLYLVTGALRTSALYVSEAELRSINPADLPPYTVMVALYKESAIIETLVGNLKKLNYPHDKLEILLLLEADDEETIETAQQIALPDHIKIVLVPVSQPRTKPKALNYGLNRAVGDLITVYDAEDFPEPDQLLKAAYLFNQLDEDVICLQAKLLYHNADTNILTHLFTAEYAKSFHLFVPGLGAKKLVVPLGGTSNHFRTQTLRDIGKWDAYNVTEDADLGVRIARMGYRVEAMESVTLEAATSAPRSWIKQRSRWIKGYMQTYLVHMRNPLRLLFDLGVKRFMGFQFTIGIGPFLLLINPFFWVLTIIYFATRLAAIEALFPPLVMFVGVMSMVVGNLNSIYYMLLGAMIQKEFSSIRHMLFTPVYWVMMSIAAWRAFRQLIFKPHYWDKTMHTHVVIQQRDNPEMAWHLQTGAHSAADLAAASPAGTSHFAAAEPPHGPIDGV